MRSAGFIAIVIIAAVVGIWVALHIVRTAKASPCPSRPGGVVEMFAPDLSMECAAILEAERRTSW